MLKTLLLLPLIAAPALATAPASPLAQRSTKASSALERGLETIQPKSIESDLYFLASDEMAGRDTPSPEQRKAARFIEARLKKLGFDPGFKKEYLWTYTKDMWGLDLSATNMTLHMGSNDFKLELGRDYYMRSVTRSERSVAKAGLVYLGDSEGARDVEADYDGDFVLVSGKSRMSNRAVSRLRRNGAVGILLLPDENAEKPVTEIQSGTFNKMKRNRLGKAPKAGKVGMLYLTEATAKHLLPLVAGKKPGDRLDVKVSEKCTVVSEDAELENVVGIWPGSDSKLKNEVIIISAHYDHVGVSDEGEVFNGADDNGSGTSGLLAVSEALKAYGPMRRTVMLQWVSGEEKGLLGSAAWTEDPWLPKGMKAVCNINMDMIGRNAPDELLITPTKEHPEYSWLTKVAEEHRKAEGFKELKSADDYYWRSDHASYRKNLNVPVIFLFADVHEDYHRVTDTPDKINYDKISRVSRLVLRILDGLQSDKLDR